MPSRHAVLSSTRNRSSCCSVTRLPAMLGRYRSFTSLYSSSRAAGPTKVRACKLNPAICPKFGPCGRGSPRSWALGCGASLSSGGRPRLRARQPQAGAQGDEPQVPVLWSRFLAYPVPVQPAVAVGEPVRRPLWRVKRHARNRFGTLGANLRCRPPGDWSAARGCSAWAPARCAAVSGQADRWEDLSFVAEELCAACRNQ